MQVAAPCPSVSMSGANGPQSRMSSEHSASVQETTASPAVGAAAGPQMPAHVSSPLQKTPSSQSALSSHATPPASGPPSDPPSVPPPLPPPSSPQPISPATSTRKSP